MGKGKVDKAFIERMKKLIKIAFPRFACEQTVLIAVLSVCLCLRTWMSIKLADV